MIPIVPPKPKKKHSQKLNGKSESFKKAIEEQFDSIKANGLNIGTTALIVGGIAFAGYIVIDLLSGKKKEKSQKETFVKIDKNKNPAKIKTKDNWLVSSIKGYILAFLIGVAREKIMEAFEEIKKDEAESDLQ